jgi:hypothetical protein
LAQYVCMIQEGQEPDRRREALANGLRNLAHRTFGEDADAVEIRWVSIAKGYAWTAGEPSTTSIVVRSVPVGYPNVEREQLLRSICELWVDTTGCSIDEIVATALDGALPL